MIWLAKSYFSLRYGTIPIEKLVALALENGVETLVLADIHNSSGIFDLIAECRKQGLHALAGTDFHRNNQSLYTGIAQNVNGFRHLNEFLTRHLVDKQTLPDRAPELEDVSFVYPFATEWFEDARPHEYCAVTPADLTQFRIRVKDPNSPHWLPLQRVSFADRESYDLHRHLRAIDHNELLTRLQTAWLGSPHELPMTAQHFGTAFQGLEALVNSGKERLASFDFAMDFKAVKNKKSYTGDPAADRRLLSDLAETGRLERYGPQNNEARTRVAHELGVIDRLGFCAYFLIAWDMIRYSMSRGFYHVGRGSGANSIVAYCLKITDVDPIELNLYFERFINPKRTSPPDFDIDFSWKDRDEVTSYLFSRWGPRHTALLGAMSTFKDASFIRELSKVYGLPKEETDRLVDHPSDPRNQNPVAAQVRRMGALLADFPNIRSIHAGGILISEEPITTFTALDMPPKGYLTTQFDMYVAEDIGFEKLDVLSQRGIGHINDCVAIIRENYGQTVDVHRVAGFKQDEQVNSLLRSGETAGCFYIESPAMRGLIRKLRCSDYITLVAASSIIRPGVARSGMMKEYIHRFHHPGGFRYIHPVMEAQLKETYGIMVYQEDVLKVCHHFAGLDLSDADVLRRAMSGKYRSKKEFQRIVEKFHSNCREKGYPEEITREVWRQIESFAGYSFSKAHSASYAVESYQSLFLKTYWPREFMVAVINNFGGFYHSWVYFREAVRVGARVHLPCVNHSRFVTSIRGTDIYVGFIHVANLETGLGHAIEQERGRGGPFESLGDFVHRVKTGLEQTILLIRTGAFRFTGKTKAALLWEVHFLLSKSREPRKDLEIFKVPARDFQLPDLIQTPVEDAYDEMELVGFPLTMSYFDLLVSPFRGEVRARTLMDHVGRTVKMTGLLVTIKYVRTIKGELMHFGTFFDADGDFFDTVHFPKSLKQHPFTGTGVYLILGKVSEEFGFPQLIVEKFAKLPLQPDPRYHNR